MRWLIMIPVFCLTSAASAEEIEVSGNVAVESRSFFNDPTSPDQFSGTQFSLSAMPEFQTQMLDGKLVFRLTPFGRLDSRDSNRNHFDLREASAEYTAGNWDALLGISSVFWGVTESRHLVNIINQVDVLEDIDNESYLGQPMIRVGTQQDWGRLDLFMMSGFREREVKSDRARLRPLIPIVDDARYEASAKEGGIDVAARYSHNIGDWDFAFSGFHGTSREPTLELTSDSSAYRPFYERISQAGVEVQYTTGPWLWKFEGITRAVQGNTFQAAVGGVEYTYFQAFDSAIDIGLIGEYLYDGRDTTAPATPFDNDIFVGTRFGFNDTQDTSFLAGAIVDVETGSTSLRFEGQRRIGTSTLIELEAQFFSNIDSQDVLSSFENENYLTLRISQYF